MYQGLAVWSPVIVAGLEHSRLYQCQSIYPLDNRYRRIENIKVRIKSHQAKVLGKSAELRVNLELICLLEDYRHQPCAIRKEEIFKDRVLLKEFKPVPDNPLELNYIADIEDLSWDADLKEENLIISYNLAYNLLATREQIVPIQAADEKSLDIESEASLPDNGRLEQISMENDKLRKQMYLYERDLGSLKRGLQKAQFHNNSMSKELNSYKQLVEELQEAVRRKEKIKYSPERVETLPAPPAPPELSLGKRIKQIFLNNQ